MKSNAKNKKQLLSLQAVAKELGVTKKVIMGLADSGLLPAIQVDGQMMFKSSEVVKFLNNTDEEKAGLQSMMVVSSRDENPVQIDLIEGGDELYKGSVTTTGGRHIAQVTIEILADGRRKRESKSFKKREDAEAYLKQRITELNEMEVKTQTQNKKKKDSVNKKSVTVGEFVTHYLSLEIGRGTSRTQNGTQLI